MNEALKKPTPSAQRRRPGTGEKYAPVSISFDPEYDTPQRLAIYSGNVREEKSGCEWCFITAKSRADLESILNAYDPAVRFSPY